MCVCKGIYISISWIIYFQDMIFILGWMNEYIFYLKLLMKKLKYKMFLYLLKIIKNS